MSRLLGARAPAVSKWLTLVAACSGLAMLMIDTFVVNVAFPAIRRDLDADLTTAQWTVSAYVLVLAVLPVVMGRLGDIFGRRRVYLAGLVLFIVASLASGLAPDIHSLIAARVLQGMGAAIMQPGSLAIVTNAFPAEQRGLAIGIWGGVSGLGLIAGPIIGGLLVHGDSWRWVFLVNLPVGALAFLLGSLFITESRDPAARRTLDVPGAVLLSGALSLVMLAVIRGNDEGWTSPLILGLFAGGALVLGAFLLAERRAVSPLVDFALFRSVTFSAACFSAFLFSAAAFGSQAYTSLFMQNYWGFTPLQAGLGFVPATLLVATLMPVSGALGQRLGHRLRLVIMAGSLSVCLSFVLLFGLETESSYAADFLPVFLLRGLGIGLMMSATSFAVMSASPPAKAGLASGTLTMSRNIGTAVGVTLLGAVFLHYVEAELPKAATAVPAESVQQALTGVRHFDPSTLPEARQATREVITGGMVRLSMGGAVLGGLAMGAAFLVRPRPATPAPERSPAAVTVAGGGPPQDGGAPPRAVPAGD